VRFVLFTNWGGFLEIEYTFSRASPAQLLDVQTNTLVQYDCGLLF